MKPIKSNTRIRMQQIAIVNQVLLNRGDIGSKFSKTIKTPAMPGPGLERMVQALVTSHLTSVIYLTWKDCFKISLGPKTSK